MNQFGNQKFMVMVSCMTYNHAPYIIDTLNGFTLQQTDFPYLCVITDDASTDGEPLVIQNYLQEHFDLNDKTIAFCEETDDYKLIYSRHGTNHNCFFAVFFLKYNHYSIHKEKNSYYSRWANIEYTAICEGDDYWTDSHKLQSQFDFLEKNQGYGMIYTDYSNYYQEKGVLVTSVIANHLSPRIDSFEQHLSIAGYIAPPSWLYRTELTKYLDECKDDHFIDTSFALALEIFRNAKIYRMMKDTCVHRIIEESATQSKSIYKKIDYFRNVFKEQMYFARKYNVSRDLICEIKANYYSSHYPDLLINNDSYDIEQIIKYVKTGDDEKLKSAFKKKMLRYSWSRNVLKLWLYYRYYIR